MFLRIQDPVYVFFEYRLSVYGLQYTGSIYRLQNTGFNMQASKKSEYTGSKDALLSLYRLEIFSLRFRPGLVVKVSDFCSSEKAANCNAPRRRISLLCFSDA